MRSYLEFFILFNYVTLRVSNLRNNKQCENTYFDCVIIKEIIKRLIYNKKKECAQYIFVFRANVQRANHTNFRSKS